MGEDFIRLKSSAPMKSSQISTQMGPSFSEIFGSNKKVGLHAVSASAPYEYNTVLVDPDLRHYI